MFVYQYSPGFVDWFKVHLSIADLFMAEDDPPDTDPPDDPNPDDPPKPKGDDDEPPLPTLEQKRAVLLEAVGEPKPPDDEPPGDTPPGDKPLGDEEEVIDWDALMGEHPEIAKLGIKTVEELASRYSGGLGDFQKNQELNKLLETAGFDTPEKRKELLLTLQSGGVKSKETTPADEGPKNFAEMREAQLLNHVKNSPEYQATDEETGEPVPLTDEQQKAKVKSLSQIAGTIFPAELGDAFVYSLAQMNNLREDLAWFKYQNQNVLNGSGGKALSDSLRQEIQAHAGEFPSTYEEIFNKSQKAGKNMWEAWHHHFVASTKKDEIDEAKSKKAQEEKEKEAQRRKDVAGSAGVHKSGKSVKAPKEKPFVSGDLGKKKDSLLKRIGERVQ